MDHFLYEKTCLLRGSVRWFISHVNRPNRGWHVCVRVGVRHRRQSIVFVGKPRRCSVYDMYSSSSASPRPNLPLLWIHQQQSNKLRS